MKYGYARVSSKGQDLYGNGLDIQEKQLAEAGAEKIFYESYTGTKKNRPVLDELMEIVREGDTVIATKLDRIARSVKDGLAIVDELLEKGVKIEIMNMGKFDDTPTGKLMRTIFFAFAEFERDMIVLRTTEGKQVKKENNPDFKVGRKKAEYDKNMFCELVQLNSDGGISVTDACKRLNISRSVWYRAVEELRSA